MGRELQDDCELSIDVDVLSDYMNEAQQVHKHNRWLNYAHPLHLCREMGFYDQTFDFLNQRALTMGGLRDFFCLLFGEENIVRLPDASIDWSGFSQCINRLVSQENVQWNPIERQMLPWIDMKTLDKEYKRFSCHPPRYRRKHQGGKKILRL